MAGKKNVNMKKVLFLDDCNLFEGKDPRAYLVEIPTHINKEILHALEQLQPGAYRIGGNWERIMKDGKIEYNLISQGRKSNYKISDYDEEYRVISGNY